jgi:hypothetical protein
VHLAFKNLGLLDHGGDHCHQGSHRSAVGLGQRHREAELLAVQRLEDQVGLFVDVALPSGLAQDCSDPSPGQQPASAGGRCDREDRQAITPGQVGAERGQGGWVELTQHRAQLVGLPLTG